MEAAFRTGTQCLGRYSRRGRQYSFFGKFFSFRRRKYFLAIMLPGSTYFSGGWTEINERGGEIVDLPQGSRIYPHATTERMIQAEINSRRSSGSGPVVVKGNTFYVREEADIDRIAYKLAKFISQNSLNYGGVY